MLFYQLYYRFLFIISNLVVLTNMFKKHKTCVKVKQKTIAGFFVFSLFYFVLFVKINNNYKTNINIV